MTSLLSKIWRTFVLRFPVELPGVVKTEKILGKVFFYMKQQSLEGKILESNVLKRNEL